MTLGDAAGLAKFLIDRYEARFVLDDAPSPDQPPFETAESIVEFLDSSEYSLRFAVLSTVWEMHPLIIREINANDGRRFFSVSQRHGGPAFDFITCRCSTENGQPFIVIGSFSDYPWYIADAEYLHDHSKYRTFDRPESMTHAHKEVRKYIRRNGRISVCEETDRSGPWILSGALQTYAKGTWLRQGNHHFAPKK